MLNADMIYEAADYLRLSKEDGDFSLSNDKLESDSISSQRAIIERFVAQNPNIKLVAEFCDDGYTGTNFDRPDFQRMMEAVKAGKINCVIVKDLSRFGRDYIDAGKYIEKIFPQLGVRFIAVNDNYDSLNHSTGDSLVLPVKNFLNDSYSRDISIKVRSSFESRRQDGEFIANYTAYGYLRDPENKNKLVMDEVAGEYVREIFQWKIEGMSPVTIAEKLNGRGVLPPSEYKRSIGIKYKTAFQTSSRSKWSPKAVIRILTNELYTGVLIQGRRTTPNYKVKKVIIKDKSEWSRIENAHEAIIPAREFQLVQRLMQEDGRRAPGSDTVYPLSGRVFCGTCGALAKRKSVSYNGKKYAYYACPTAKKTGGCEGRNISERELETAVLTTLQSEIKLILDVDRALGQVGALAWERREIMRLEAAISAQEAEIAKYRTLKTSVYEDLRDGLITQDEFLHMKQDFSERISFIEDDISGLKTELDAVRAGLVNQTGWLAQFRQYRNLAKLTRTVVVNLIDKIHIYPDKKITVTLLCKDQLTDVIAFLREQVQTQHAAEKEAG